MRIYEATPFFGKWLGTKFPRAGLRYELEVSIESGKIVWINGTYARGENPGLSIFRHRMKKILSNGEMLVTNNGYTEEHYLMASNVPNEY